MNDETNQAVAEAPATEAAAAPAAEAKPAPVPRVKLVIKNLADGTEQPLLKYAFPVKAPKFAVTINGEPAEAATTTGKGKSYTYFLVKNTSFYVPGLHAAGSSFEVNFPADYKFDEAVQTRVSNYKPKKAKDPKPADAAAGAATDSTANAGVAGEQQAVTEGVNGGAEQPTGEKAKRRKG